MLTPGHLAISYLLTRIVKNKEIIGIKDILFILIMGNVLDLDIVILSFFKVPVALHHVYPVHTPLFGLLIGIVAYVVFRKAYTSGVWLLSFLAMMLHLVLDDLAYWLYRLGMAPITNPQINWLYPLTQMADVVLRPETAIGSISVYLRHPIFYGELLFVGWALVWGGKAIFKDRNLR